MKLFRSILYLFAWIGQIALGYLLGKRVWALEMIPFRVFFIGCILLILLWALEVFLYLRGIRLEKQGKGGKSSRIAAFTLILLSLLVSVIGIFAANKLQHTLHSVTEPKVATTSFSVFVLKDDPAQTIADMDGYLLGVATSFDTENTNEAIRRLSEKTPSSLKTEDHDTVQEMVDALYAEKAGAILLNSAYVPILEETEGYETFGEDTRALYDIDVVMQSQPAASSGSHARPTENLVSVPVVTQDPFVVYLSGSDTRSDVLLTGNSDVNILVAVNPATKNILLLNTPRDYYIPNPAGDGALDKLTHCGVYGISCSVQALSDLYDETINYYAQINFKGFESLINAVGGITVDSDYAFTTRIGHYQISKGPNQLNGAQALGFVRERYFFNTGDNQRGLNQMKAITAVIQKLTAGNVITHYNSILDSLQGMFVTSFSSKELSDLVKMQLNDGADWNVHSFAVTGSNGMELTYSIPRTRLSVMYQDKALVAKAANLLDRVISGETISDEDVL